MTLNKFCTSPSLSVKGRWQPQLHKAIVKIERASADKAVRVCILCLHTYLAHGSAQYVFIIVAIITRVKATKPGLDVSCPGGSKLAGLTSGGTLIAGRKLFGPSWLSIPTETQHFNPTQEGILNC